MEALALSTEVLDWAAGRVGETLYDIAHSIAKRKADQDNIAAGKLTVRQAEKLAKRTRVPFGFLFLTEPPELPTPQIPDLRRVENPEPLSQDFYEVLADVLHKQSWYLEHVSARGAAALPFVGKFKLGDSPAANLVAQDIRATLRLSEADRRMAGDAATYFGAIATRAEDAGILVMKNGVVKSASRRALSEREFRGFAIANGLAPLVFVNGQDAQVAAVFTLAHELAHIWLGVSGVSDVPLAFDRDIERLCNAVAAALLVPEAEFRERWTTPGEIPALARYFRVSQVVVARRALDFGLIQQAEYDAISAASVRKKSSGGDGLRTVSVRNSKRFTRALVSSVMSGETLIREAASLLNVRPETVMKLGTEKGD
jgi:Zn-dependent peptidase ImmA (M78 family)